MSDRQFERAVTDWLEDGSDRTPERAIDGVLLAVKTTPQERDLRIPWRLPQMPVLSRAVGIAAVALVVMVGAGGLIFLAGSNPARVVVPPSAAPTPTTAPSPSVSPATGWNAFTSPVHGYTLVYPEGWVVTPAKPAIGGGDAAGDMFVSPDNEIGLGVGKHAAGDGADLATVDGLKAWATRYCTSLGMPACSTFTARTEPMCVEAGGDPCRAAILVRSDGTNPDDSGEYAFFGDWGSAPVGSAPDTVITVGVGRGDAYPGAAPYGGAVQLLRTVLSSMGVTAAPTASPEPSAVAPGITGWTPFISKVYGYTLGYPEGWQATPATREWQPSDGPGADGTSDQFVRSDNEIGVGVSKAPAGDGAEIETVDGLKAWAEDYCTDLNLGACDTFTDRAEPMCLNVGGDPCRAAILVRSDRTNPDDASEYVFFGDWAGATPGSAPDKVTIVGVGRGDAFAGAAQYGGAVQLLTSIVSTMGITAP